MYRGPAYGGRSRATPATTCQNYECKASAQERPYVSRPSRTQQLFNPKLKPQLTSDVPNDLLRKKGVADETLANKAVERGRKHSRDEEDLQPRSQKRSRSVSSISSVSTISTNRSPSRSPPSRRPEVPRRSKRSPATENRKRRRRPVSSSAGSDHSEGADRPPAKERNTRRRRSSFSPGERGRRRSRSSVSNRDNASRSGSRRRSRSRDFERSISPYSQRARVPGLSPPRRPRSRSPRRRPDHQYAEPNAPNGRRNAPPPAHTGPPAASFRERSLSPYSKRLAMTQAMNTGGR